MKEPSVYKYLQDHTTYSDRYDHITVEKCRSWEARLKEVNESKEKGDLTPEEMERVKYMVSELTMYTVTGDCYAQKSETIKQWMEEDRKKDEKLERAKPIEGVRCLSCGTLLECISKDLNGKIGKEQVTFLYLCPSSCKGGGRIFDEYGREEKIDLPMCGKCHVLLDGKSQRDEDEIEVIYTCSQCGDTRSEVLEFPKKIEDTKFIVDRQRFCLSDEEGGKYIQGKRNMEEMSQLFKDIDKRKENEKKLVHIQKLTIGEVQKKLSEALTKEEYGDLKLSAPEIGKDLIVGFTVIDTKSGRTEYESKQHLKKSLNLALTDTNWKLMSDGVSYRMGFLSGRLRGLEKQEDLIKEKLEPDLNKG